MIGALEVKIVFLTNGKILMIKLMQSRLENIMKIKVVKKN